MTTLNTGSQVFEAMRAIVEAPGFTRLTHYKQDFYEYDKNHLEHWWHPEAQAIWIVRECGTHLNFIGSHQRAIEQVEASLGITGADDFVSHVTSKGIRKVTKDQALWIGRQLVYSSRNGALLLRGKPIGTVHVETERRLGELFCTIDFHSGQLPSVVNDALRQTLISFAGHEAVERNHTFFVRIHDVRLNGVSVFEPEVILKRKAS